MIVQMMWFKREPKAVSEKAAEKENGVVSKLRKKKPSLLKPTRESSERETSTESDKDKRRFSDILDIKVSQERRDDSDESLYESADGQSDTISASDDAIPRLGKTPTISKESLKLAVTDEEADIKFKKGHRKAMSLSNPIEMVKNLGDEWLEFTKKDLEKHSDKKKSRESLWSEEDKESIHGSTTLLDQIRRSSRKEDKSQSNSRKSSNTDAPKSRKTSKASSVTPFNFLRRKKTPTSVKPVEVVAEDSGISLSIDEVLNFTKLFLEGEKRYSSIKEIQPTKPLVETDSEDEPPTPKQISERRRRLSRQTSRGKSKVRGKSQSLKVNTLRKSHSGTLKKGKKKIKTPSMGRSRQTSIVEQTPLLKKKNSDTSTKSNSSWFSSGTRGESKREGSNEEPSAPDDVDTSDAANNKEPDKDNTWRVPSSGRGVNRAESCRDRERELPRRGKHRNASDPNRLTAHNNHDLEPGAPTAPSGSSSSSSLSSRSNESNTVAAEQHASQSDLSEEDEHPLATQWSDSIPARVLEGLTLSARLRKRQEVIHELIVSEGSHLRWLKVLGGVFLRPLEGAPLLLPPEDLRALFPNLPSVRERHARLYAELRALRADVDAPLVHIRGVADAILNTLGDSGYAPCLAKFCRGQRMALESLRERRRKNKELHAFLMNREQQPLCGRLQLRDLLACVWQRLTKYQLLLEGVAKTVTEADGESEEDVARLNRALTVAKDVLHSVDTAIRTAENDHRLRTIQSKLEVRAPSGPEFEELRRLELTQRSLKMEGELSIKNDNNKKINVLALMLEDCLVLIQREGDKFVLKPISQTNQHLSPLIKWDKVLFRPNAAVRNTFFLMNINGVQMHELSANSAPEYATWVKYIQDAPLAKLTELKPTLTPSHQPSQRSTDDSGINVSRNPSDASEKSNSTAEDESERDRTSAERSSTERERESNIEDRERESVETEVQEKEVQEKEEKEEVEKEEKHKPRRPTEGRIVTHSLEPAPTLEPQAALTVQPPASLHAATAERVFTHQERLRRLDEIISRSLRAKSAIVAELLHVPPLHHRQVADLAVAEALGQVDITRELRSARGQLSRSESVEEENSAPDMHQLLLAACTQANQLTSMVSQYLSVNEAATVAARQRCDACHRNNGKHSESFTPDSSLLVSDPLAGLTDEARDDEQQEPDNDVALESNASLAELAARLVSATCGVQHTLSVLLSTAPPPSTALREEILVLRETNDALRAHRDHQPTEEISFIKGAGDTTIQDQPSNGG